MYVRVLRRRILGKLKTTDRHEQTRRYEKADKQAGERTERSIPTSGRHRDRPTLL